MTESTPEKEEESKEINSNTQEDLQNPSLESDKEETEESEEEDDEHIEEETIEDFSKLNKEELIEKAKSFLYEESAQKAFKAFSELNSAYDSIEKPEIPDLIKAWVEAGNEAKDFVRQPDKLRNELNGTIIAFKKKRKEEQVKRAKERLANYTAKQKILDQMKAMFDGDETEDGLKNFRNLMNDWRQIRQVPNEFREELNKTFEVYVDQYFDTRKMHQELFEVDRQKNMDAKIELIQKVQGLKDEKSIRKSMILLKQYREEWRTIGPVKKEHNEDIWQRFQAIMKEVYEEKTNLIADQNEIKEANLKLKEVLVEKAELAVSVMPESPKAWSELYKKTEALMEEWKSIGPVPKENSDKIWVKFNGFRTDFFAKRKEFFGGLNERKTENLKLKQELCLQAEALMNETHWKNTSEALQELQGKWKEIGPVPDSKNDKIWKRFRAAFDHFYNAKKEYFAKRKTEESSAVEARNTVLLGLEALKDVTDAKEVLSKLKEQQKAWGEAGHVSGKAHFSTYNKYRALCDELYDRCRKEGVAAKQENFKEHLNKITSNENAGDQLGQEERRIRSKMRNVQEEINSLENNKNFFANTKNAQSVIAQFDSKIEVLKRQIEQMNKDLNLVRTVKPKDAPE